MLKQKHVDAAREVRLWLSQVIIPIGGIFVLANKNAKNYLCEKKDAAVEAAKKIFER